MNDILDLTNEKGDITMTDMYTALRGYVSVHKTNPTGVSLNAEQVDKYLYMLRYPEKRLRYNYSYRFHGIPIYLYDANLEEVMNPKKRDKYS